MAFDGDSVREEVPPIDVAAPAAMECIPALQCDENSEEMLLGLLLLAYHQQKALVVDMVER
jgi:hypothetical protein